MDSGGDTDDEGGHVDENDDSESDDDNDSGNDDDLNKQCQGNMQINENNNTLMSWRMTPYYHVANQPNMHTQMDIFHFINQILSIFGSVRRTKFKSQLYANLHNSNL